MVCEKKPRSGYVLVCFMFENKIVEVSFLFAVGFLRVLVSFMFGIEIVEVSFMFATDIHNLVSVLCASCVFLVSFLFEIMGVDTPHLGLEDPTDWSQSLIMNQWIQRTLKTHPQ